MKKINIIMVVVATLVCGINNTQAAVVFQDNFENNTAVSTAAWPDGTGDFDPDNAAVGSWWTGENDASDVQVTSYVGGSQPTSAHSGSNYLIAGWHHEYYGGWTNYGRAIANFSDLVDHAVIDFWVWGEDGMHAQIVGRELAYGDGNGVFLMVLDDSGAVHWATGTDTVTLAATWTAGVWNHVVIDLDVLAQTADITINDQSPETFPAAYEGGAPTIGSIRFEGDFTASPTILLRVAWRTRWDFTTGLSCLGAR